MKDINIDIPEGYEIDMESSNFIEGRISFKPVQKKWKDVGESKFYYFTNDEKIYNSERNVGEILDWIYPTEELLLAAEALRKLLFWRNKVWKEDGDWHPDFNKEVVKYTIIPYAEKLIEDKSYYMKSILSFRTKELRNQFLKDHIDLIEQAKSLL